MQIKREVLVNALQFAKLGLADKGESIEQSNAFVFTDKGLFTFNDEILTCSKTPLDFQAAIVAADFLKILEKIPDEEVEVALKGSEVRIKGAKREAGISAFQEVLLPFASVPAPEKWSEELEEKTIRMLMQAARTCSRKDLTELTAMVHVTPDLVEACDNFRFFRATGKTGFPSEILIPAESLLKVDGLGIKKVSIGEGWAHFQTDVGHISMRCSHQSYHDAKQLNGLLSTEGAEDLSLPNNLGEILSRAEIVLDKGSDSKVSIRLESGKLFIKGQKDGAWYKEEKRIKYDGADMGFEAHPKFLVEMLEQTRAVKIIQGLRMKMEVDGVEFVVALTKESE